MYNGVYTAEQYAYVHDTLIKWLELKIRDTSLGYRLREKGISSVAVYGINDFGQMVYEDIRQEMSVIAFVDRKAEEENLEIDGLRVLSPTEAADLSEDCYILVTPEYYFRDIAEKLMEHGVREDRILSLAMVVS